MNNDQENTNFHEIDDFNELYNIRRDKKLGWQTFLEYKLLEMSKQKNTSLNELRNIFYDYYFRKSRKNHWRDRAFYYAKRQIITISAIGLAGLAFFGVASPFIKYIQEVTQSENQREKIKRN